MFTIRLKPGRERPVKRRHPWLFSGAIATVDGSPDPGETVDVVSAEGEWLARAAYSPNSQIRARIWSWEPGEAIDEAFFYRRLAAARSLRSALNNNADVTAFREIHAESDLLPGLILDRYGPYRVVQFLSWGVERYRDLLIELLAQEPNLEGIYERSDSDARQLEGLHPQVGSLWGSEPPERLQIEENGLTFWVDIRKGHKTGFYLDQRVNRAAIRRWIHGQVLDAFCYTGGFTIASMAAGVQSVVSVDSSAPALGFTKEHITLNGFRLTGSELVEADVFQFLRTCRDSRRQFDSIILDPPKFAATSSQVDRAARGYKDINLLAFKLLRPGGTLITFSCSGGVNQALFEKIVADAALDAEVEASTVAVLSQSEDHPVRLQFPEGRYLKGLVCRLPV